MKHITTLALLLGAFAFANEIKMKEVNDLIYYGNKKIVVVDKKDLGEYITTESGESLRIARLNGVMVDNFDNFKKAIVKNNSKQVFFDADIGIVNLLLITRYVFKNNIENDYYFALRPLLVKEAEKHTKIDQVEFKRGAMKMNIDIAGAMLRDIQSIIK